MPKGLQKILAKSLQQNASDRYQDIVDFMTDVSTYLHSPALLKENKELDPLSDLSESLRQAQLSLTPKSPPSWPDIDIGFSSHRSMTTSGVYYDFFTLPNNSYGIIIGEPSIKESPGILYSSVLRGMVRALSRVIQDPQAMTKVLNSLLLEDPMKQQFSFTYLLLKPKENRFSYISCKCAHLFYQACGSQELTPIITKNPKLCADSSAEFTQHTQPWHPGDSLRLYAALGAQHPSNDPLFTKEQIESCLMETSGLTSQKQADAFIRKAKLSLSKTADERSVVFLSLIRHPSV
jgi:serine phosphatase RsbU (regulator of sigma subunit)